MRWFVLPVLLCLAASASLAAAAPAASSPADRHAVFAQSNLAAWCIVPFDAKKRGPEERAAMLEKLGFTRFVYDYRAEHVPTFEAEIEALARHHVRLTGWWFPTSLTPEAKLILDLIKRHGLKECDLWITGGGPAPSTPAEEEERLVKELARIKPLAAAAADAGVKVGLYNHGGWFGEPETQLKIIERLQQQGVTNVGMVYNLHHGHSQVDRLAQVLPKMKPHLLCLNLNGMVRDGEARGQKIVPIAQGELDLQLLRVIRDSGYQGPIGILNHTNEDAEARLQDNLDGLRWLVKQLDGGEAGPRPVPQSWKAPEAASAPASAEGEGQTQGPQLVPSRSEVLGKALKGGLVLPGKDDFHELPVTVECLARLDSAKGFNILVACEPKSSPLHWELYSYAGSGVFSLYLPGRGGEYKSRVNICDGQWHRLSAIIETDRVRLKVDNKQVLDAAVAPVALPPHPAQGIAFGRLVEKGTGCDGIIDEVRIARGSSNPVGRGEPLLPTDATLGLWNFDNLDALKKEALSSTLEPEPFSYVRTPLNPDHWPNHRDPVNRERIYDYYPKQALAFKGRPAGGLLLPAYPGLDGGTQGHWGNQSDDTWRDGRWKNSDLGSLFSGVLKGEGLVVPKGVSVRVGEEGAFAACFDPLTASFPLVWKGGLVKLSEVRHGFMEAAKPGGPILQKASLPAAPAGLKYHGFYRHGSRVLFSYAQEGVEMLDAMWVDEQGQPARLRSRAEEHPWKDLRQGGPARWSQVLETTGALGGGRPYALDTLTLPYDNPYGTLFFVSDHDFFPDGTLALCTMTGEVWLVRGVNDSLAKLTWKRHATGLHQPQGLVVVDGKICVLGRDQITRLHDLNNDDEADFYECVTNAMTTSPSGHDYLCGLQRDAEGRFYFSSGNQGVCRVKPGEAVEVLATGFRNPNGLGLSAEGHVTTSCQEGDWTPASMVCEVKPGGFYGLGGPRQGKTVEPPLLYLPRGVDNSAGGQCYVESDAWGVPRGTLLTFSCGACTGLVVLRDASSGQAQGAAWELPADFLSGAQRGRFHQADGQLYVSGMYGWGCYGPRDGCLQRVRYTGGGEPLPVGWEVRQNGVMVSFNQPVDVTTAREARQHFVQVWNYITSSAYGSQEWSVKHPRTAGHDALEIASVQVLEGGRKLFLEVPQLTPASQVHLHVATGAGRHADLYGTMHQLGQPFTDFPGARPLVAKARSIPASEVPAATGPARVNPWAKGESGRPVKLEAALGLQFAQKQLVVKAGERISLEFSNPDAVPHNVLFIKPGALQKVGDLANKMITDPEGLARHYVPESPEVLVYTDMVQPGQKAVIHFNAPKGKGDYPYLCTFPGHWLVMNGVLRVE